MILGEEVKFDFGADFSREVVGAVLKSSICANSNFDSSSSLSADSGSRDSKAKESIGELHYN